MSQRVRASAGSTVIYSNIKILISRFVDSPGIRGAFAAAGVSTYQLYIAYVSGFPSATRFPFGVYAYPRAIRPGGYSCGRVKD